MTHQRFDIGPAGLDAGLRVALGGLDLATPVMPASGCFGPELATLVEVTSLGAVVTKTVFHDRRPGNTAHRLAESASGMLNSVGIPSPGIDDFLDLVLPRYLALGPPVVASIGGLSPADYVVVAKRLAESGIAAFEVNVSCPNLEAGGLEIGSDPAQVHETIGGVVAEAAVPVFAKLTPNVTSIAEIARSAESAGAAAVTVANSVVGMRVNAGTRRTVLGNRIGGLSGPAIKPIALRLVWEAASEVRVPVIGCGGISTVVDAVEFFLVGASAIQVGTATFAQPDAMMQIVRDLPGSLRALGAERVDDLIGAVDIAPEQALAVEVR